MRFLAAAVLVLTLTMPLAWAQQMAPAPASPSPIADAQTHNFGRVNCPQHVPCPGGAEPELSAAGLLSIANGCITQYFGYSSPSGFFDDAAGLDANNCFTAIPGIIPKGAGNQLVPSCCIINSPTKPETCVIHCEQNTVP